MIKLCTNCHYIGKALYDIKLDFLYGNVYIGIIAIALGIYNLVRFIITDTNTFSLILGLILIPFGIAQIKDYYHGGEYCPQCKQKDMISLDTPEAQALIKENNLTIPEEASQKSSNPKTSQ